MSHFLVQSHQLIDNNGHSFHFSSRSWAVCDSDVPPLCLNSRSLDQKTCWTPWASEIIFRGLPKLGRCFVRFWLYRKAVHSLRCRLRSLQFCGLLARWHEKSDSGLWRRHELRTKLRLGGPIEDSIGDYIGFWGDLLRDILRIYFRAHIDFEIFMEPVRHLRAHLGSFCSIFFFQQLDSRSSQDLLKP